MLVKLGLGPQPRKTSQGSTGATHQNPSDYIMFLGEPLDKAVILDLRRKQGQKKSDS